MNNAELISYIWWPWGTKKIRVKEKHSERTVLSKKKYCKCQNLYKSESTCIKRSAQNTERLNTKTKHSLSQSERRASTAMISSTDVSPQQVKTEPPDPAVHCFLPHLFKLNIFSFWHHPFPALWGDLLVSHRKWMAVNCVLKSWVFTADRIDLTIKTNPIYNLL